MIELRLGLLLALCAPPAFAADWLLIWSGRDEVMLLDRESIRRGGGTADTWAMQVFDHAVTLEDGTVPHRSRRLHVVADCRAGRYGYAERVFLSDAEGAGTVVHREKPAVVNMAVPDTAPGKMLLAMLCPA